MLWRRYLTAGLALTAACELLTGGAVQAVLYDLIGLGGVAAIVLGIRRHRPQAARAWWLLAAGQLLFVAGDATWKVYDLILHRDAPVPSLIDVFWLPAYPLLAVALVLLLRRRGDGRDRASLVDAAIVALGAGMLMWVFVLGPFARDTDLGGAERIMALLYPSLDLLLLAVAVRLAIGGAARTGAYWLLMASWATLLGGDVLYSLGTLHEADLGTLVGLLYLASYVTIGAASLHPAARCLTDPVERGDARLGRWRLAALAVSVAIAPLVLFTRGIDGSNVDTTVLAGTSLALFLLVVVRMAGLVAELRTLVARDRAAVDRERTLRIAGGRLVSSTRTDTVQVETLNAVRELLGYHARASFHPLPDDDTLRTIGWTVSGTGPTTCFRAAMSSRDDARAMLVVEPGRDLDAAALDGLLSLCSLVALAVERLSLSEDLHEQRSEQRFRALVQNTSDLIVVVDEELVVRYATPSLRAMLDRGTTEIEGRPVTELAASSDSRTLLTLFEAATLGGRSAGRAVRAALQHRDGTAVPVEATIGDLRGVDEIRGFVLTFRDVSERLSFEQQLHWRAFHDALTGLPNRALFEQRITEALDHIDGDDAQVAAVFCDLDDFKTVNDSLGHEFGDRLLVAVAARMSGQLRVGDLVARLGGDEFAMLLPRVADEREAFAVAERIVAAMRAPVDVDGRQLSVGVSVGIALSEPVTAALEHDGAPGAQDLLRGADIAMYEAKRRGKGQVATFASEMQHAAQRRLQLKADIELAIEREQFVLYYQPIVDLHRDQIVGFEALIRWEHPREGLLMPSAFVALAEETNLIVPIGRWALREACLQAGAWQAEHGARAPYISVNVAGAQLREDGFLSDVGAVLDETGIDPALLVLELTESSLIGDGEESVARLRRLRRLGMRLAIDDFGTGYSALNYLRRFPVDLLKIDRSFVHGVAGPSDDATLVHAIAAMGRALGLKLVAEGIEQPEQLAVLRAMQCDLGQGYHFAPALPVADAGVLLGSYGDSGDSAAVAAENG